MTMAVLLVFSLFLPAAAQAQGNTDCEKLKNVFNTDVESVNGVCKVEIIREHIKQATFMGKKLSMEMMELAFHFSFEKVDGQTAVMGELALLQDEVNPVLEELAKGKLEVSALHNHMLFEKPRIMYLHFQGIGDMEQQAETIKAAIEKTSK
ncbi:DUF1259 domain-containing protein [Bacillus sp. ISL-35]|uniref:DUF1259 domain-containing protein n=1 Tax=Bacillus sp. ISL-35 TaxID=2819122 RepID=UPI0020364509|nr:DUF1259 domain-containing protein [Bacillus sp. ISL-35]